MYYLRRALLGQLRPREQIKPESGHRKLVRVLVVGGNEKQAKMQARIIQKVKEDMMPLGIQVEIDFEHPGWGSKWNLSLERMDARIQEAHIVVTMKFMRTMYGRGLRRKINQHGRQWRDSHGHAPTSISRSISLAAQDAVLSGSYDRVSEMEYQTS